MRRRQESFGALTNEFELGGKTTFLSMVDERRFSFGQFHGAEGGTTWFHQNGYAVLSNFVVYGSADPGKDAKRIYR